MKCKIVLENGKWKCIDESGRKWCSFDVEHRDWAVQVAEANGFKIV